MAQLENILQGVVILSLVTVDDVDDNFPLGFICLLADRQPGLLQDVRDQRSFRVGEEGRGDYGDVAGEAWRPVGRLASRGGEVWETVAWEISWRLDWERVLELRDRI